MYRTNSRTALTVSELNGDSLTFTWLLQLTFLPFTQSEIFRYLRLNVLSAILLPKICRVSVHRGGWCLPQCMLGCHTPPWDQADPPGTRQTHPTPPGPGRPPRPGRHPPRDQGDPPGTRQTPPGPGRPPQDQADPPGSRLQHTVYERPVRILLECILVITCGVSILLVHILLVRNPGLLYHLLPMISG